MSWMSSAGLDSAASARGGVLSIMIRVDRVRPNQPEDYTVPHCIDGEDVSPAKGNCARQENRTIRSKGLATRMGGSLALFRAASGADGGGGVGKRRDRVCQRPQGGRRPHCRGALI